MLKPANLIVGMQTLIARYNARVRKTIADVAAKNAVVMRKKEAGEITAAEAISQHLTPPQLVLPCLKVVSNPSTIKATT